MSYNGGGSVRPGNAPWKPGQRPVREDRDAAGAVWRELRRWSNRRGIIREFHAPTVAERCGLKRYHVTTLMKRWADAGLLSRWNLDTGHAEVRGGTTGAYGVRLVRDPGWYRERRRWWRLWR